MLSHKIEKLNIILFGKCTYLYYIYHLQIPCYNSTAATTTPSHSHYTISPTGPWKVGITSVAKHRKKNSAPPATCRPLSSLPPLPFSHHTITSCCYPSPFLLDYCDHTQATRGHDNSAKVVCTRVVSTRVVSTRALKEDLLGSNLFYLKFRLYRNKYTIQL